MMILLLFPESSFSEADGWRSTTGSRDVVTAGLRNPESGRKVRRRVESSGNLGRSVLKRERRAHVSLAAKIQLPVFTSFSAFFFVVVRWRLCVPLPSRVPSSHDCEITISQRGRKENPNCTKFFLHTPHHKEKPPLYLFRPHSLLPTSTFVLKPVPLSIRDILNKKSIIFFRDRDLPIAFRSNFQFTSSRQKPLIFRNTLRNTEVDRNSKVVVTQVIVQSGATSNARNPSKEPAH